MRGERQDLHLLRRQGLALGSCRVVGWREGLRGEARLRILPCWQGYESQVGWRENAHRERQGMTTPLIYHCTPMTPRDCLETIGAGRNLCVSFWRPDDVEVVERIASTVMFRQRRVLGMASSVGPRRGMVRSRGLDPLLSLAGTAPAQQSLGDHTGCAGCAFPAQRRAAQRVALPTRTFGAGVAHGRPRRSTAEAVRQVADRLHRMDWDRRGQGGRMHGLVRTNAGNRAAPAWSLAAASSSARGACLARISLRQSGREQRRTEWTSL